MRYFLVGHRGTGKSSLLQRIQALALFQGPCYDLDLEIEKRFGSLPQLFEEKGENYFRQCEARIFKSLAGENKAMLMSLGAGFDMSLIGDEDFVIWVRRDSDKAGRIFLNRPRLEKQMDPLAEFQNRATEREKKFSARADAVYTLPEGLWFSKKAESEILGPLFRTEKNKALSLSLEEAGIETLTAKTIFRKKDETFLEVRSDQWTDEELKELQSFRLIKNKIYSQRTSLPPQNLDFSHWSYLDIDIKNDEKIRQSWPQQKIILSTHEDDVAEGIAQLKVAQQENPLVPLYKLCPRVETWEDLILGFRWWKEDPLHRNFLPRSSQGRWSWFRLWMKGRQKLNFIRESFEGILDQPSLYWWIETSTACKKFAAVLGSPVHHSFSPSFHSKFFSASSIPFFAIDVREDEFPVALPFLQELGLRFAAVTSPLKKKAYLHSHPASSTEQQLEAVNTLTWDEKQKRWLGNNTDLLGFQQSFYEATSGFVEKISGKDLLLWGGRGVLNVVKATFPDIRSVSAREGLDSQFQQPPRVILWASSRSPEAQWPPHSCHSELIFDFNYTENSMGLELAEKWKSRYFSGLRMFCLQAEAQQKIWRPYL